MCAAYHLLTRRWPKNYLREDGYLHAHDDALDTNVRTTLASSYPGTSPYVREIRFCWFERGVPTGAAVHSTGANTAT